MHLSFFSLHKYCCFNWILGCVFTHSHSLFTCWSFFHSILFFFFPLTVDICLFNPPEANYCVSWISRIKKNKQSLSVMKKVHKLSDSLIIPVLGALLTFWLSKINVHVKTKPCAFCQIATTGCGVRRHMVVRWWRITAYRTNGLTYGSDVSVAQDSALSSSAIQNRAAGGSRYAWQ